MGVSAAVAPFRTEIVRFAAILVALVVVSLAPISTPGLVLAIRGAIGLTVGLAALAFGLAITAAIAQRAMDGLPRCCDTCCGFDDSPDARRTKRRRSE